MSLASSQKLRTYYRKFQANYIFWSKFPKVLLTIDILYSISFNGRPRCFLATYWSWPSYSASVHHSSKGAIHQMDQQTGKKLAVKSQNLDYSHFVSLPLAMHPELVNKLINFRNSVLGTTQVNQNENLGIEKSIFISPKTFHLTVLMLKLGNKDRIEAAAKVLRSVSSKVIDALENRPVSIRLKGLECMKGRGTPAKAYVVHAPVEVIGGEARLLRACQVIINAFTEAGLVLEKDANQRLKLHATIMNARHRKSKKGPGKTDPFDARTIFGQYGRKGWGECLIREAHLSQRSVYDDNGYFHCCASIPFPDATQGVSGTKKNIFQKMFCMGN